MRQILRSALFLLVLLPAAVGTIAVRAQEQREKIARVSVSEGETSYQRGDDQDWNALGANTPLMTGDSLYAAQDGRAEIELGDGNAVRLDNSTALEIVNLSNDTTQLGLSQGNVNVRVREIPANRTMEMDTPLAAATFWEPGLYRVGLDGDSARFGVVSGKLSVVLNGEQLDVQEGEILELQGGNDPSYGYSRLSAGNDFDQWSEGRDARRQRSTSNRYVHSDVIGYDDLDDNGSWQQDRTYGNVWYPAGVSSSWAPYQTGRWMWQDPYGWTWVSYEPWGWAPYHYGRWVYVGNSWGWVPPPPMGYRGPRAVMNIQPYYSPALVAFVGGSNWSVGISIGGGGGGGHVGWVPLAPIDPYYYPWQRPVHVTNVVYQNIYIDNSVTVVNYNNFSNGPVNRIPVGREAIRRAPVMGHSVIGIAPGRGSLAPYPGVKLSPRAIPAKAVRERALVVRNMPPPRPVPFDRKVTEVQKTGKPYAKPVVMGANVGKPFKPGMKAPEGVMAKPALGHEGSIQPPRLKAKQGQEIRQPKPVGRDVVRPTETPQKTGGTEGRVTPTKPVNQNTSDQKQPGKINPPANRQPEQPKKEREVRPPSEPAAHQPEQSKKEREVRPPAEPAAHQPEQPKKEREVRPPAEPAAHQPEQPKTEREVRPPAEPAAHQPEQPKKEREVQPPTQPDNHQPGQPKDEKEMQPPAVHGSGQPEKANKPEGAEKAPQEPEKSDVAPGSGDEKKVK